MAATLVTLAEAKAELRITHAFEDDVITRKLAEAEAAILDYLKFPGSPFAPDPAWDGTTVPPVVRSAICLTLVDLMLRRGDGDPQTTGTTVASGWPSARVRGLLERWRDPALA
jgi:Phage gp6-like head-tail connector protein